MELAALGPDAKTSSEIFSIPAPPHYSKLRSSDHVTFGILKILSGHSLLMLSSIFSVFVASL